MSGGMYGNGTHQGDEGGALSVSAGNQGWPLGESDLEPTCEYKQGGIGEEQVQGRLNGGWDSASHRSGS